MSEQTNTMMQVFRVDQKLRTRSTGDYECVFEGIVIKRTLKTVTIETSMNGISRCKIYKNEGEEFIFPFGKYSMAPIFRA